MQWYRSLDRSSERRGTRQRFDVFVRTAGVKSGDNSENLEGGELTSSEFTPLVRVRRRASPEISSNDVWGARNRINHSGLHDHLHIFVMPIRGSCSKPLRQIFGAGNELCRCIGAGRCNPSHGDDHAAGLRVKQSGYDSKIFGDFPVFPQTAKPLLLWNSPILYPEHPVFFRKLETKVGGHFQGPSVAESSDNDRGRITQ